MEVQVAEPETVRVFTMRPVQSHCMGWCVAVVVVGCVAIPEVIDRRIEVVGETIEGVHILRKLPVQLAGAHGIAERRREPASKRFKWRWQYHRLTSVLVLPFRVHEKEQLIRD